MKIPSIFTNTFGLLSFIFIDVGIEHSYLVTTERVKKVIAKIDKKRGIITVADKYHHFYPSSFVKFTSMSKSLKILEKNGPFQVTSFISNTQFAIQLPPSLLNDNNNEGEENEEDEIETGGICEEVEELFTISHVFFYFYFNEIIIIIIINNINILIIFVIIITIIIIFN